MSTYASPDAAVAEYAAAIKQDRLRLVDRLDRRGPRGNRRERSRDKLPDSLEMALREALQMNRRSGSRPLRRGFMRAL